MLRIGVMIISDLQMIREGLVAMLRPCQDIEVVNACEFGETIYQTTQAYDPDVILMDNRMRAANGANVVEQMLAQRPQTKIIIINVFKDANTMCRDLQAGVHGYIPKYVSSDKLIDSIKQVYQGEKVFCSYLVNKMICNCSNLSQINHMVEPVEPKEKTIRFTSREKEILLYLAKGMTNKELSVATHLSVDTVKTHLRNIFRKLDVKNRYHAVTHSSKHINLTQ